MPQLDDVMTALRNADAAGDHEAAQKLAGIADQLRQQSQAPSGQGAPAEPEGKTPGSVAGDIATATGVGAAIGAATPEILQGLGGLAMGAGALFPPAAPLLEPAGSALIASGSALRTARVASAVTGAIGGLASETAGQTAEAIGMNTPAAMAARLGVGLMSPGAAEVASYVSKPLGAAWKAVRHLAGEVSDVPKAVVAAREALQAKAFGNAPQIDFYEMLSKGVNADIAAADKAAGEMVARAHERAASIAKTDTVAAQRAIDEATAHGASLRAEALKRRDVLNTAANGRLQTASRVRALADKELEGVGKPALPSDVGNSLRQVVSGEQKAMLEARSAQYKELERQRDAVVAEKQSQGLFLDSVPEVKAMRDELAQKALLTVGGAKKAAAAGRGAEVADPGIQGAYRRLYEALGNKRVQTGVGPDGNPTFTTFKTTFEAVDAVRRKLGDVAYGKAAEGYDAIGQGLAKEWYARLSKIQEDYAGPVQRELQSGYSEATGELGKFLTAGGKKVVGVDPKVAEEFVRDPASIPGNFFRTQKGVKDLLALTNGNREVVESAARGHVAHELQGKGQKQAQQWLKSNEDWLRELPAVQKAAMEYAGKLGKIERVGVKLEDWAAKAQEEAGKSLGNAATRAEKLLAEARKEASLRVGSRVEERAAIVKEAEEGAAATRKTMQEKAAAIVKAGYPAEATKKLLLQGSPEELKAATRYLAGEPGGKLALEGSVRGVMRGMGEKELAATWQDRLRPMLKEGRLLDKGQMAKLEQDVAAVLRAFEGKEARTRVQKLVTSALGTVGGDLAAQVKRRFEGGE